MQNVGSAIPVELKNFQTIAPAVSISRDRIAPAA
jgi:hypothetical protein